LLAILENYGGAFVYAKLHLYGIAKIIVVVVVDAAAVNVVVITVIVVELPVLKLIDYPEFEDKLEYGKTVQEHVYYLE
jgi:hypothetical protein